MRTLPEPSESFHWVEASSGPGLVCRPFESFASHLFTTRHWRLGSLSAAADDPGPWREVADAIGVPDGCLFRARQVHGTSVAQASDVMTDRPAADILVGNDPTHALAVQSADCVPLLIVDQRTGAIAAAHAGWRGLAAGVPGLAIEALRRAFGCRPADLLAAVGPSIGPCCYEVGQDVSARFAVEFGPDQLGRWFLPAPKPSRRNPLLATLRSGTEPGRWVLDCWASARDQIASSGVPPDQIFIAELCTASHPDALCSYRRDGPPAGRLAAVIKSSPHDP